MITLQYIQMCYRNVKTIFMFINILFMLQRPEIELWTMKMVNK